MSDLQKPDHYCYCIIVYVYSLVVLVTGIQVAIIFLGSGRLDDYVGCLEESLQQTSVGTVDLTDTSIPVCLPTSLLCVTRTRNTNSSTVVGRVCNIRWQRCSLLAESMKVCILEF